MSLTEKFELLYYAVRPFLMPLGKGLGPPISKKAIVTFNDFLALTHKVTGTHDLPLPTKEGIYISFERHPSDPLSNETPIIYINFEESYGHGNVDSYLDSSTTIKEWDNAVHTPRDVLGHNLEQLQKKYVLAKGNMYSCEPPPKSPIVS